MRAHFLAFGDKGLPGFLLVGVQLQLVMQCVLVEVAHLRHVAAVVSHAGTAVVIAPFRQRAGGDTQHANDDAWQGDAVEVFVHVDLLRLNVMCLVARCLFECLHVSGICRKQAILYRFVSPPRTGDFCCMFRA